MLVCMDFGRALFRSALVAEHRGVPGRPRQRADDRGRQHHIGRGFEHRVRPGPGKFAATVARHAMRSNGNGTAEMAIDCQTGTWRLAFSARPAESGHGGENSFFNDLNRCAATKAAFRALTPNSDAADPIRV